MATAISTVTGISLKRTDGSVILLDEAEQAALRPLLTPPPEADSPEPTPEA